MAWKRALFLYLLFIQYTNSTAQVLDSVQAVNIINRIHSSISKTLSASFQYKKIYKPLSSDSTIIYEGYCEFSRAERNASQYANFLIKYRDSLIYYYNGICAYKINLANNIIYQINLDNAKIDKYFKNSYESNFIYLPYISPIKNKLAIEYFLSGMEKICLYREKTNYHLSFLDTVNSDSIKYSTDVIIDSTSYRIIRYSETIDEIYIQYEDNIISDFTYSTPILDTFDIENFQSFDFHYYDPALFKPKLQALTQGDLFPSFNQLNHYVDSLEDRLLLLDFFHKNCAPCWRAIPMLGYLNSTYSGKGLQIIGIDPYDRPDSSFNKFIENKEIKYPIYFDANKKIMNELKLVGFPHYYLINVDSREILYTKSGYSDELPDELEKVIIQNLQ